MLKEPLAGLIYLLPPTSHWAHCPAALQLCLCPDYFPLPGPPFPLLLRPTFHSTPSPPPTSVSLSPGSLPWCLPEHWSLSLPRVDIFGPSVIWDDWTSITMANIYCPSWMTVQSTSHRLFNVVYTATLTTGTTTTTINLWMRKPMLSAIWQKLEK